MRNVFPRSLSILLVVAPHGAAGVAQDPAAVVRDRLLERHAQLGLTQRNAKEWAVASTSTDRKGVTRLYVQQRVNGLPVHGAVANFVVRDGEVLGGALGPLGP